MLTFKSSRIGILLICHLQQKENQIYTPKNDMNVIQASTLEYKAMSF